MRRQQASGWRKGLAVTKLGFKESLAYKFHYFVSLFGVPVNVLIYYFLWKAIFTYSGQDVINGYTLQEMVTYYVIVMLVGFITYSQVDEWIEYEVVHGHMVNAMMKPLSYFKWHLYNTLGMNSLGIIIQIIPVMLVGLALGLKAPSPGNLPLLIIAITIAAALYHLLTYLTGLAAFWLLRIRGLRRSRRVIVAFLSGSMLPLTFFPAGMQKVFSFLPFTFMRFTPVQIYMGKVAAAEAVLGLCIGLAWVLALYLVTRWVWERAFKKFSGAGI
ncbi:ABC-2 family transporter protein [Candidatus Woesearchaeota archaeon]|nr:ABC-2 family transporter protein [Candidatus Woesearchaeota archaeon]